MENKRFGFLQSIIRNDHSESDVYYLTKWLFTDHNISDKKYFDLIIELVDKKFFDRNNTIKETLTFYIK